MSRVNAVDKLAEADRQRLEVDISASDLSWRDLQAKWNIPQATLRSWADRNGVVRNPSGLKRALVERALARPEVLPTGDAAQAAHSTAQRAGPGDAPKSTDRADIEAAAAEDVRDMRMGLQASRMALLAVTTKLQKTVIQIGPNGQKIPATWEAEPKELKILSEAVAINIGTIRLIRGLDIGFTPEDMAAMSDDQLRKITAGQRPR